MSARIAAVVLARDRPEPTQRTLDGLLAQEPAPDHLLLIDNEGTPEVRAVLERAAAGHASAEILRLDENRGCSGGFEAGLERLLARDDIDFICGFDDDATPLPGCLPALAAAAQSLPDVGAVGAISHDPTGTLAWPMVVLGEDQPVFDVDGVRALAAHRDTLPVHNLAWHGLMFPVPVLRRVGNVWGDLWLQYEDIELGMRIREAGLNSYLVPEAECIHPPPPPSRAVRIFGRQIDVTAQNAAKEYLTLRNGLVVRHRHDGLRFWYGTGPFVLLRGFLSALALDVPKRAALRHVFVQGVVDAVRGRLGPPPPATMSLSASGLRRTHAGG
jgi:rhamnopyranosyl-N-acetylglucosaminyl-diphospho-decaprenol beta-1,3/1,4-galactofuranosyltransferase